LSRLWAECHSAAEFHSALQDGAAYGRRAACGRLGIGPLRQNCLHGIYASTVL